MSTQYVVFLSDFHLSPSSPQSCYRTQVWAQVQPQIWRMKADPRPRGKKGCPPGWYCGKLWKIYTEATLGGSGKTQGQNWQNSKVPSTEPMSLSERNNLRERATSARQPTRASAGRQKAQPDRAAPSIDQLENRQLSSGGANYSFSRGFTD